jgi:hypothetical protein
MMRFVFQVFEMFGLKVWFLVGEVQQDNCLNPPPQSMIL